MADMINGNEVIAQHHTPAAAMTRAGRFVLVKVKKGDSLVDEDGKEREEWATGWQGDGDNEGWIDGHYFQDQTEAKNDFVMRAYPDFRSLLERFSDELFAAKNKGESIAGTFDSFIDKIKAAMFSVLASTPKSEDQLVCPVCFDTVKKVEEGVSCNGPGITTSHEDADMVTMDQAIKAAAESATKAAVMMAALRRVTEASNDIIQGAIVAGITIHMEDAKDSIDHDDIETATLHLAKSNKIAKALIEFQGAVSEAKLVLG